MSKGRKPLNKEQEDALLRFDPTQIVPFMLAGRPEPRLLQQLKYRGLCARLRVPLRSYYRWELTWDGEIALKELRKRRGLPEYPKTWGVDD